MSHRIRSLTEVDPRAASLVILDLDGVIVDLELDWSALKAELSRHCDERLDLELDFGSLLEGRSRVLESAGEQALAALDAVIRDRELESLACSRLREDFRQFLDGPFEGRLAVCSANSRATVESVLERAGCRERFSCIVGREDVERSKPSPDGLRAILEQTGCERSAALFVGDRESDVLAGEAAGVTTYLLDASEQRRLEGIAGTRSYAAGFNGYLTRFRARIVRELCPSGGHLLDLGCGEGNLTEQLLDHFDHVSVVEASERFLSRAHARLGERVEYLPSLVEEFRPTERYDCIVASGLLEHIEQPVELLRRLRGWLKQSGRAVLIVPNAGGLHRRLGVEMGMIDHTKQLQPLDFEVGHRRYYDQADLREHVEQAGLHLLREEGILLKPLSNSQMESWPEAVVDALYGVGRELPDYCAEIVALCSRAPLAT